MDISHPLGSLIPSLDSVVLEVLAGTERGLGVSRIHSLGTRGSRPGVAKVLDRLTKHGLVVAEPANHGNTYRLNRNHLLVPALFAGLDIRKQLFRSMGELCANPALGVTSAAVFGSVARRDSTADSDIDLLLVVEDDVDTTQDQWADTRDELVDKVRSWTGNRLEVLVVTVSHLQNLGAIGEPIVSEWIRDARTIHGTELVSLVSRKEGAGS